MPITGPVGVGHHSTTNIFVCNANIPPIRSKKLDKQVFVNQLITSTGTFNFPTGTGPFLPGSSGNFPVQGILKQILISNISNGISAGGIIGVAIAIDTVTFQNIAFFQGEANFNSEVIIPLLDIRSSLVTATITLSGTGGLAVSITVIFVDHSGSYPLT
jgi:hypothetical protein